MNKVAEIYDHLFAFESKKKESIYPIHKKLNFSNADTDLLDFILTKVDFDSNDRVLDAGCGTGYSLLRLAKEKGVIGKGISVSSNEICFANGQAKKLELTNKIGFEQISFDHPLEEKYDKIIAIESLRHSENIEDTLKNLYKSLSTQGTLIIADDFILSNSPYVKSHKKLWEVQSFKKIKELKTHLKNIGYEMVLDTDLTNYVPVRSKVNLIVQISILNALNFFTFNKFTNLKTYLGGIILEYLYVLKNVQYALIIATNTSNGRENQHSNKKEETRSI